VFVVTTTFHEENRPIPPEAAVRPVPAGKSANARDDRYMLELDDVGSFITPDKIASVTIPGGEATTNV
jgi:hypothetical protein